MTKNEATERGSRIDRFLTVFLSASLVVTAWLISGRRVAPRVPTPMAVSSVPVPDSVWEALVSKGHTTGPADASDTLVVFSDYECPFCAAMAPELDSLLVLRPNIAVLYRYFPLSVHPYALDEAVTVECAARFGKLREAQALMYSRGGEPVDPARVAGRLGITADGFESCWSGRDARQVVESDRTTALKLAIPGTPAVFFSDARWSHFPFDLDQLLKLVGPVS